MNNISIQKKWNAIYSKNRHGFFPPAIVLHRNKHLLPRTGKALDLACGTGRNAIYLNHAGLETHAWDISDIAIHSLEQYCTETKINIHSRVIDIVPSVLLENSFDIVVVSHFLNKALIPAIKNALNPGGLIFYQTFIEDKVSNTGPSNLNYLLKENELLTLFSDFIVRHYTEEGTIGDINTGIRNEAMIIAEKMKP